jgi:septal ring factor EnvC (AmiA/AmiB activator)
MTTEHREKRLGQLPARRQQLRHELARVERQIMQARHEVRALETRIADLSRNQQKAA